MLAEVSIVTENRTDAVIVPSDAVVTRRGQNYVAVLAEDDKIELRPVTVGIDNGTDAEITSSLSAGETIVVRGQDYVSDGEQVRVVEQPPAKQDRRMRKNRQGVIYVIKISGKTACNDDYDSGGRSDPRRGFSFPACLRHFCRILTIPMR